jgi:hypothetical protein
MSYDDVTTYGYETLLTWKGNQGTNSYHQTALNTSERLFPVAKLA